MKMARDTSELSGKLLVAMPGMGDPRFDGAVVFLCEHGDKGSMGLIINKPSQDLNFDELLEQLDLARDPAAPSPDVHFGGPVEMGRGFVLHSADYGENQATLDIGGAFSMTATIDVLEDMASGRGPERAILALGYAGWAPGQLEGEIVQNGWLVCDATPKIVFDLQNPDKWKAALRSIGVDPKALSSMAGRA